MRLKLLKVTIDEGDYAGLIAWMKRLTVGQLLEIGKLKENADGSDDEATEALFKRVADALDTWDLEDYDGTPIPPDFDGIKAAPFDLVLKLVEQWMDTADVPDDLGKASSNGAKFPVELPPMEPLSPNLSNSFTPD